MQDFFQIYDLDFNPIPLPTDDLGYGLRGLDLTVSSISQEVVEHTSQGIPGSVITGVTDREREMVLHARLKAKDTTDYRLKRDRVFSFFKNLGSFYVAESQQGNKLMKVRVVEPYSFVRPTNNQTFATVDIPLKIDGQPYWISRFKTMDLHQNKGIEVHGGWSFGMGLDVDLNRLIYQHSNKSQFNIYNAGTVKLKTIQEKDNCTITLDINQSVTNFTIHDDTGRRFEYNPQRNDEWTIQSGSKLIFNGHYMILNNTPILERTNRYFFVLLPGDNQFKIDGLSNYTITFDFRFKYY